MIKNAKKYVAADFGASCGKISVGRFEGRKLTIEEIRRFDNSPVRLHDTLYWDFPRLFHELCCGLTSALGSHGDDLASVGIDTWGIDFGLLDRDGRLLSNPVCYRDKRTHGMLQKVEERIPAKDLFMNTGEGIMEINTVFQLYSMIASESPLLRTARRLVLMPDLFNYFLTGNVFAEFTAATTTQLFDQRNLQWSSRVLDALAIPMDILPEIVHPGERVGETNRWTDEEVGTRRLPVVATGSHDVACAVAGLPIGTTGIDSNWAFLIIGTWSILGAELRDQPIITHDVFLRGFANEGGIEDTFTFEKIFSGLWLIQECRREWMNQEARDISWEEIVSWAEGADPGVNLINLDDPVFNNKSSSMCKNISDYYRKTRQPLNLEKGNLARTIYEGLVLKCRLAIADLERLSGRRVDTIYLTGGGSKNRLLRKWIADALGKTVIYGLPETTTIGNVLCQMLSAADISNLHEGRQIVATSFRPSVLEASTQFDWDGLFERYKDMLPTETDGTGPC